MRVSAFHVLSLVLYLAREKSTILTSIARQPLSTVDSSHNYFRIVRYYTSLHNYSLIDSLQYSAYFISTISRPLIVYKKKYFGDNNQCVEKLFRVNFSFCIFLLTFFCMHRFRYTPRLFAHAPCSHSRINSFHTLEG